MVIELVGQDCPFYEQIDNILGPRAASEPHVILDSNKGVINTPRIEEADNEESNIENDSTVSGGRSSPSNISTSDPTFEPDDFLHSDINDDVSNSDSVRTTPTTIKKNDNSEKKRGLERTPLTVKSENSMFMMCIGAIKPFLMFRDKEET